MKIIKNSIAVIALSVFTISCSSDNEGSFNSITTDLSFSNGNLSTGAKSADGTSAPTGYTWSEMDEDNFSRGIDSKDQYYADDFVVPKGEKWNIDKINIYAFYGGYKGTTSPFNNIQYEIYNGNPSLVESTVVYGDITQNKYASAEDAKIYRIHNSEPNTDAKIFRITANATDLELNAGTYWIKWQIKSDASGIFYPTNATAGSPGLPSYNAIRKSAQTWGVIVNGYQNNTEIKVDFPFELIGKKTK